MIIEFQMIFVRFFYSIWTHSPDWLLWPSETAHWVVDLFSLWFQWISIVSCIQKKFTSPSFQWVYLCQPHKFSASRWLHSWLIALIIPWSCLSKRYPPLHRDRNLVLPRPHSLYDMLYREIHTFTWASTVVPTFKGCIHIYGVDWQVSIIQAIFRAIANSRHVNSVSAMLALPKDK